jgi:hypothetical protein
MWLEFIANDLKWMGVKRWRNTAEDRNALANILKVALVKLGHAAATSQKVAGSVTDGVIRIFVDLFLPAALGPRVDSASKRNEYQEYILWGKGGRCIGLTTLPPPCVDCHEVLEPQSPGNLRACTGIALPFSSHYLSGVTEEEEEVRFSPFSYARKFPLQSYSPCLDASNNTWCTSYGTPR